MATEKFLPYARQSINESDIQMVSESLRQDVITRGKNVEAFEKAVASYTEAKYAVAFSNGSAALFAAFQAKGGNSSDTIFTTPNSFVATASGGKRLGMSVHFSDIDTNGNIDLDLLEKEINRPRSRGRAFVVPVHFAGVACDMKRLSEMIKAVDTIII